MKESEGPREQTVNVRRNLSEREEHSKKGPSRPSPDASGRQSGENASACFHPSADYLHKMLREPELASNDEVCMLNVLHVVNRDCKRVIRTYIFLPILLHGL